VGNYMTASPREKALIERASSIRNGILIECPHPLRLASANCSIFPYLSQYHEQPATILHHQTRNHNPSRRNYCRHKTVARQPGDFFYRPSSSKLYSGDSRSRLGSSRTTTLNSLSSKMILTFLSSARSPLVLHTWLPRLSSLWLSDSRGGGVRWYGLVVRHGWLKAVSKSSTDRKCRVPLPSWSYRRLLRHNPQNTRPHTGCHVWPRLHNL